MPRRRSVILGRAGDRAAHQSREQQCLWGQQAQAQRHHQSGSVALLDPRGSQVQQTHREQPQQ
ncbi:hypothetical protein [uncultured Deinococcus sp.]|uniref:hypothetical protein n=1 Tax=uncultured Deinococcus sp. TaxID=158789 RepID=UPI0025FFAB1A|nr:hypothetical protein [uncultured Deinococcus sp.]